MNIYDISEKAGVSIATVSRVLNENSNVSVKTREKVLRVMEETGYQPNVFARGLGLNSMSTIGILCADNSDLVLANAVYHIERELHRFHYNALLCCTGYEHADKEKYLNLLLSKRVDAIILAGSSFVEAEPELNEYIHQAAETVPVMIVNGYLDGPNIYCTVCDDRRIICDVTSLFLQKTDRILYLQRFQNYSSGQKLGGVMDAFLLAGKKWSDHHMLLLNGTIEENMERLEKWWKSGNCSDVIISADDELAACAYKFAGRAGIRVPDELQIVGYNNSIISVCCEPEITSVDNHLDLSSREAVRLLMKLISGEMISKKTVISGNVVIRGTTKDITKYSIS